VRLSNVVLERLGHSGELRLQSLTEGLNVIYGPEESGKSDLMASIPWVLYGPPSVGPVYGGSANVGPAYGWEWGGKRSVSNAVVAALDITDDSGQPVRLRRDGSHAGQSWLGTVREQEFRQIYCVGRPLALSVWSALRNSMGNSMGNSLSWAGRSQGYEPYAGPVRNAATIELQISEIRARLGMLPMPRDRYSSLEVERDRLHHRLSQLGDAYPLELDQRDRDLRTARQAREQVQNRIDRMVRLIERIDERIRARNRFAGSAWYAHHEPLAPDAVHLGRSFPWDAECSLVGDRDRCYQRWSDLQARLRSEVALLRDRLRSASRQGNQHPVSNSGDRLVYLLRSLEMEVEDLESRQDDLEGVSTGDESRLTIRNLKTVLGSLLGQIVGDKTSIGDRTLVGDWVERDLAATSARDLLHRAVDYMESASDCLQRLVHELPLRLRTTDRVSSWGSDRIPSSWTDVSPTLDSSIETVRNLHAAAIDRLRRRRESLVPVLERLRRDLWACESRMSAAWERTRQDEERSQLHIRLAQVEHDLKDSVERERLVIELHRLESELNQAVAQRDFAQRDFAQRDFAQRDDEGLYRDASILLRRVTGREFHAIRWEGTYGVSVEDTSGVWRRGEELYQPVQEIVSTCLQLASVAAMRRSGHVMPLLVHADQIGWGPHETRELVHILAELAASGQQILIFVARQEVVSWFERYPVHVYTLVRRTITERVRPSAEMHQAVADMPRREDAWPRRETWADSPTGANWTKGTNRASGTNRDVWTGADAYRSADIVTSSEPLRSGRYSSWGAPVPTREGRDPHAAALPTRSDAVRPTTIRFESDPVPAQNGKGSVKYYLHHHDNVVDAPSIGPKTADRLYAVGVRTVEDLMRSDPAVLAGRLEHRGMTAAVVGDWQDQSRLICQVPFLRGHDAGLLVACGVRRAADLARQDPGSLLEQVDRFAATQEGRRILRGGKKPDLVEVQDWIRWAQHAHSTEAA